MVVGGGLDPPRYGEALFENAGHLVVSTKIHRSVPSYTAPIKKTERNCRASGLLFLRVPIIGAVTLEKLHCAGVEVNTRVKEEGSLQHSSNGANEVYCVY